MENHVLAAKNLPEMTDYLLRRRSVPIRDITGPGPESDQLNQMLQIAARVPDHGKLCPWFFVVIRGDARSALGQSCADIYRTKNPDATADELTAEENRFLRAPVVVAVIHRRREGKSPWWEQILSAGAACYNLTLAAQSTGFAANWLTEWVAYHADVKKLLGLDPDHDHIAGYVYIGSMKQEPVERDRPDMAELVTYWHPGTTVKAGDVYDRAGFGFAVDGF